MTERSQLATLPYGLYGESLCNRVTPMQLSALESGAASLDPVPTANFLVLYTDDVGEWEALYPESVTCWSKVSAILANENYPRAVTVFADSCR